MNLDSDSTRKQGSPLLIYQHPPCSIASHLTFSPHIPPFRILIFYFCWRLCICWDICKIHFRHLNILDLLRSSKRNLFRVKISIFKINFDWSVLKIVEFRIHWFYSLYSSYSTFIIAFYPSISCLQSKMDGNWFIIADLMVNNYGLWEIFMFSE